jgi:hypothetical protein
MTPARFSKSQDKDTSHTIIKRVQGLLKQICWGSICQDEGWNFSNDL